MFEPGYTVGELEQYLLGMFPASDAEEWDRTGITVGDPRQEVTGIVLCLDPTVAAVTHAASIGANVVITHHPAFLEPPAAFGPLSPSIPDSGSLVWEAARHGIALMNFHTALDVSPLAANVLPGIMGMELQGILEVVRQEPDRGYGQICVPVTYAPLTLLELQRLLHDKLGRRPRAWGDPDRPIFKAVSSTGSGGFLADACLANGIDCLVCGEVKYHDALAAWQKGLCIIELGHDVSELPLVNVLHQTLLDGGCPASDIHLFKQDDNWN